MADEYVQVKLPIRLISRRGRGVFGLVVSFIGVSFASGILISLAGKLRTPGLLSDVFGNPALPVLLFAVFLFLGLCALVFFTFKVMLNGHFFYLEISVTGLRSRRILKAQGARWQDIERISVVDQVLGDYRIKRHRWWVLAEGGVQDSLRSADRRISRALLAYDATDLAPFMRSGEDCAKALCDKLNDFLKCQKLGDQLPAIDLPLTLGDLVVRLP